MDALEVESKFSAHGPFVVPELVSPEQGIVSVERRPTLTLRATYVDTPTLRLAREGITLRHRTGEGRDRWTLKLPACGKRKGGLQRTEVSIEGAPAEVPTELTGLLVAVLRGVPVSPVASLTTRRETYVLTGAGGRRLGEVVDDTVTVLEGRRVVSRFREIEVEETGAEGSRQACRAVAGRLLEAGAVAGQQLPKVVRALGPQAQQPSDLPTPPEVGPDSEAAQLVRWSLRSGLAKLVSADLSVRRKHDDAVHQLRVACRRMRSDLRTFAALLDDPRAPRLHDELAWLAGSLGEARELEVLIEGVRRTACADPLSPLDGPSLAAIRRLLMADEAMALEQARAALETTRYVELLQLLVDVANEPGLTPLAGQSCDEVLPDLVGAAWRHLAKRAKRLHMTDGDEDWHRARILAKRARYAAEIAAVALGKPAKETAKSATEVQELLGEHQDAAVAASRLLALADRVPHDAVTAVTCGRLAERERARVRQLRQEFAGVWRKADSPRATRWLRA